MAFKKWENVMHIEVIYAPLYMYVFISNNRQKAMARNIQHFKNPVC